MPLFAMHSDAPWLSQTADCRMAVFLTPTVASAADASTQDVVSNSDTILCVGESPFVLQQSQMMATSGRGIALLACVYVACAICSAHFVASHGAALK